MKRFSFLIFGLYFFMAALASAQDLRLPRDPEKLMLRAQGFWAAVVSRQRLQALEFVLPEKKELYVSGNALPVVKAKVLGVDLTGDINRAAIRVILEALTPGTGPASWTITDSWVWRRGNWYVELGNPGEIFPKSGPANTVDVKKIQEEIEKTFEILQNPVDLGTLIQGDYSTFEIPIKYTGDAPISLELGLPNPIVDFDYQSTSRITSSSRNLVLLVTTADWEGAFDLPLPLKIQSQGATVERVLVVKGSVFAPLTFRQDPPDRPLKPGEQFSLFLRNNTSQEAGIRSLSVEGKALILKEPRKVPPNEEVEVVFKRKPDDTPDKLYIELETPIQGRDRFTYRFRNVQQ